jgi:hypothetical protein
MAVVTSEQCGIHSRRLFVRAVLAGGSIPLGIFFLATPGAAAPKPMLAWGDVTALVSRQLATRPGYQAGDLISQGDVTPVFKLLEERGWKVADKEEILQRVLDDGHFLVKQLRTEPGVKFARGVAKEALALDHLDRLCAMPGGQQLVHDMLRLPNGQAFMSKKPTQGFTDLTILLPKQANGKTPRDPDFDKPTGKIYTEAALLAALEKSWKGKR